MGDWTASKLFSTSALRTAYVESVEPINAAETARL
jgi:hypothetical protein